VVDQWQIELRVVVVLGHVGRIAMTEPPRTGIASWDRWAGGGAAQPARSPPLQGHPGARRL